MFFSRVILFRLALVAGGFFRPSPVLPCALRALQPLAVPASSGSPTCRMARTYLLRLTEWLLRSDPGSVSTRVSLALVMAT